MDSLEALNHRVAAIESRQLTMERLLHRIRDRLFAPHPPGFVASDPALQLELEDIRREYLTLVAGMNSLRAHLPTRRRARRLY